ncbi:MAG: ADP-glyceromanno-heptose 6-epimerase [Parachlamydiales bacterium]|nr:ADP-glyceromanno-heptose 6-epimerase [Parachlamydiales bacterium]
MQKSDDKLIVVTGGAGFIGSGVIRYLNDQGRQNIVVVDELGDTDKWKNLVGKSYYDILDKKDLNNWLVDRQNDIKGFIHLGACSDTMETDASYLLENNYRFSVNLAEYALKHGHRFIYASSAATYGDGLQGFSDNHQEIDHLKPLNMYGYSKHIFDLWLKRQGVLDKVVGLKYFNVFGPNEWHKGRMSSAVVHLLKQAQQEGVVRLFKSSDKQYGDGDQVRDFLYVKDAAAMTCAFLDNSFGGLFNIGFGKPRTWNDLAKSLIKALGKDIPIEYIPMPQQLVGKYQNYTCADMSKHDQLGLTKAQWPLEKAVEDYVSNYLLTETTW